MPVKSKQQFRITKDYLAGFFDGEGCISVDRKYKSLKIIINNTNLKILELIKDKYGGRLTQLKRYSDKHSPLYCWELNKTDEQIKFLKDIELKVFIKEKDIFCAESFVITKLKLGGNRRYGKFKEVLSNLAKEVRIEVRKNLEIIHNLPYASRI